MTAKERILKILSLQRPDRIGMHDMFLDSTLKKWKEENFLEGKAPAEYFGFDFGVFNIDDLLTGKAPDIQNDEKFMFLGFAEPFQKLCGIFGREDILRRIMLCPKRLEEDLINETYRILEALKKTLESGVSFDGAWVWGDLAYNDGLFISPSWYKRNLLPMHKRIFRFLNSRGVWTLFHSDGNISGLIPQLLNAGVRALHPLEENSRINFHKLLMDYKDDMVFVGHMDIENILREENFSVKLRERINTLKEKCFYIYHADYPIMPNISFRDYKLAIKAVKEAGGY